MARSSLLQRAGVTGAVVAALVFGQPSMGQALSADPAGRGATAAWQDTTPAGKKQAADRKEAAARKKASDELAAKSKAQRLADKPDVLTARSRPRYRADADPAAPAAWPLQAAAQHGPGDRRPGWGAGPRARGHLPASTAALTTGRAVRHTAGEPMTSRAGVHAGPAPVRLGSSPGLPTGEYVVTFYDVWGNGYLSEFFDDQQTRENATLVSVTAGEDASGINAGLVLGGSVSGTVTSESGPAIGNCVHAYAVGAENPTSGTCADDSGAYTINGLPAGDYELHFDGSQGYLPVWFTNAADRDAATSVPVRSGQNTDGIDQTVVRGASISGTFRDAATGMAPDSQSVCAEAFQDDQQVASYCTWEGGADTYSLTGLPAGSYTVQFTAEGYATQWWEGAETQDAATPLTLDLGEERVGIDARFQRLGTITGTVTDAADGSPLRGVCVEAVSQENGWGGYVSCTGDDGTYELGGLPTDDYLLEFVDTEGTHIGEWFDNSPGHGGRPERPRHRRCDGLWHRRRPGERWLDRRHRDQRRDG